MDEYDLDILSCRADSSDLVLIYSFPSGIYRKESLLEVYVTLVFVLMAWDITSFIGYIDYCDIVVTSDTIWTDPYRSLNQLLRGPEAQTCQQEAEIRSLNIDFQI